MAKLPTTLNKLCTPAYVYFAISVIFLLASILQNIGNKGKYTLGSFTCTVPSCIAILAIKAIYIVFWTWVLNLICNDGHTDIAWFLVLLPFILLFIVLGLVMISQKQRSKSKNGRRGRIQ